jgi:hypothetical protein
MSDPHPDRRARRPGRGRLLGLAILGLAVGLLVAEGVVRIIDSRPRLPLPGEEPAPDGLYAEDPRIGLLLAPSFELTEERFTTNSIGLRDRERSWTPAPEGTLRVVLLGDSFVAGVAVADDEHLAAQLEAGIAAARPADAGPVEVWNLGIPGQGVEGSLMQLEARIDALQPDVVVLGLFEGNDPIDDLYGPSRYGVTADGRLHRREWRPWRASRWKGDRAQANKPLFVADRSWDRPLFRHSFAWRRLLRTVSYKRERDAFYWPDGLRPFDYETFGCVPWLYLEPEPSRVAVGWSITVAAVEQIAQRVERAGATMVLASFPARVSVDPYALPVADATGWTAGNRGSERLEPDRPAAKVATEARRLGIPLVTFRAELIAALRAGESPYYVDDSHFTAVGQRVAAEVLGRELGRLGLVTGWRARSVRSTRPWTTSGSPGPGSSTATPPGRRSPSRCGTPPTSPRWTSCCAAAATT